MKSLRIVPVTFLAALGLLVSGVPAVSLAMVIVKLRMLSRKWYTKRIFLRTILRFTA